MLNILCEENMRYLHWFLIKLGMFKVYPISYPYKHIHAKDHKI